MYFIKTPFWLKRMFGAYTWHVNTADKELYLTFDDGPHPVATPFVLEHLAQFNARASFFCLGKNVLEYPAIYQDIITAGHTIGNHTHNHLNGWKVPYEQYLDNINKASAHICSKFFRPPYGRITRRAGKTLIEKGFNITMWDVLSGDFDRKISSEKCKNNVIGKAGNGSIIVFHDSEKAFPHLRYALPEVLSHFRSKGFVFKGLADN